MDAKTLERNGREFLGRWGIALEDLAAFAPPVAADECLVLCSTIPEGLANDASDIDLLYLGDGALKGTVHIQMDDSHRMDVSHDPAGREINVTQVRRDELERMEKILCDAIGIIENRTWPKNIKLERDPRRLMFAHRLRDAVPLVNAHVYEAWRSRLRLDQLHLQVCLHRVTDYLNLQENVVGELNAGQVESAGWVAKSVMARKLVVALLASVGVTNPSEKWHMRLLRRHQDEIGAEIVERLLAFMWSAPPHSAEELKAQMLADCEPALQAVYARQRQVHRAAYKFSYAVRYLELDKAVG